MKPLEIIPSDLAAAVSEEIMAEKMMDEEDIFFVKWRMKSINMCYAILLSSLLLHH